MWPRFGLGVPGVRPDNVSDFDSDFDSGREFARIRGDRFFGVGRPHCHGTGVVEALRAAVL
jgi:hypothetical protein